MTTNQMLLETASTIITTALTAMREGRDLTAEELDELDQRIAERRAGLKKQIEARPD